jgi:tRNA threonylcarbamoyladenosine biosynthesis protein TsaE
MIHDLPAALPRRAPLPDLAATGRLGEGIAAWLAPGLMVALSGDLGAGKTALARAILAALGHSGDTPSPTFTLVQSYDLPGFPVAHADLYRLKRPAEIEELGIDDLLEDGALIVGWPERAGRYLPPDRLDVRLAQDEAGARNAALDGHGAWPEESLEAMSA